MKLWIKYLLITLVIGIPAFFLGHLIWPSSGEIQPSAVQLPFYILLGAIESLLFGFGVAFIIFTIPKLRKLKPDERKKTIPAFIAVTWFLVSWWPHDNFHMHNGNNPTGLLLIEYGFHVTLVIASLIIVKYFYWKLKAAKSS